MICCSAGSRSSANGFKPTALTVSQTHGRSQTPSVPMYCLQFRLSASAESRSGAVPASKYNTRADMRIAGPASLSIGDVILDGAYAGISRTRRGWVSFAVGGSTAVGAESRSRVGFPSPISMVTLTVLFMPMAAPDSAMSPLLTEQWSFDCFSITTRGFSVCVSGCPGHASLTGSALPALSVSDASSHPWSSRCSGSIRLGGAHHTSVGVLKKRIRSS